MNLIKRFVIKTMRILVCITIGTVIGVSLSVRRGQVDSGVLLLYGLN